MSNDGTTSCLFVTVAESRDEGNSSRQAEKLRILTPLLTMSLHFQHEHVCFSGPMPAELAAPLLRSASALTLSKRPLCACSFCSGRRVSSCNMSEQPKGDLAVMGKMSASPGTPSLGIWSILGKCRRKPRMPLNSTKQRNALTCRMKKQH